MWRCSTVKGGGTYSRLNIEYECMSMNKVKKYFTYYGRDVARIVMRAEYSRVEHKICGEGVQPGRRKTLVVLKSMGLSSYFRISQILLKKMYRKTGEAGNKKLFEKLKAGLWETNLGGISFKNQCNNMLNGFLDHRLKIKLILECDVLNQAYLLKFSRYFLLKGRNFTFSLE